MALEKHILQPLKSKLKDWLKRLGKVKLVNNILSFFIFLYVRFVQLTSRTEYRGVAPLQEYVRSGRPVIAVLWHSRSLFMGKLWRRKIGVWRRPLYALFSSHRDGRYLSNVYRYLGIRRILVDEKSAAGSRRVVFKVLKKMKAGYSIGITPDGPRGPALRFNTDSVFLFALKSGAPIVPLYMSATRAKFLRTWDRFMVVNPFSRSVIEAGDFVRVREGDDFAALKSRLEKTMRARQAALDEEMAG